MSVAIDELIRQAYRARGEHRLAGARRDLVHAVELARTEGGTVLAKALVSLGQIERDLKNRAAALRHYGEAVEIYRAGGDPLKLAHTVRHVGDIQREDGRPDRAEPCYDEALAIYRAHDGTPPLDLANAIRGLAILKQDAGENERARSLWMEARDLYASVDVQEGVAECSRRLGLLPDVVSWPPEP